MESDTPNIAPLEIVWVFSGAGSHFASGVFSDLAIAEAWIAKHRVSGTLTLHHVDEGAYDWSIRNGFFVPRNPEHTHPNFIGRFTGGQQHHHYENGEREA
jgi:hypothetical protein